MNEQESLTLCRLAKAMCPQQAMDEYTPDAWHMLLEPLRFEDCKEAMVSIGRRQPFIAPAEVYAEVRRIRANRIDAYGHITPPADVEDERAWFIETRRRIGDGELVRRPGEAVRQIARVEWMGEREPRSDASLGIVDVRKRIAEARAAIRPLPSDDEPEDAA